MARQMLDRLLDEEMRLLPRPVGAGERDEGRLSGRRVLAGALARLGLQWVAACSMVWAAPAVMPLRMGWCDHDADHEGLVDDQLDVVEPVAIEIACRSRRIMRLYLVATALTGLIDGVPTVIYRFTGKAEGQPPMTGRMW